MKERARLLSKWTLLDALVLLALAVYEFCTRLDAMTGPLKMFVSMAVGERIPLKRVMTYVDVGIFEVPFFMLLCAALAVLALCARRRSAGQVICFLAGSALFVWGLTMNLTLLGEMVNLLKLLPLFLLALMSLLALANRLTRRRAKHPAQDGRPGGPRPDVYDNYTRRVS